MGCQTLWFFWGGAGALFSIPFYTLWIAWHGWFSRKRETSASWKYHIFTAELIFRLVFVGWMYTLFRWSYNLNPLPWDPRVTYTVMPLDALNLMVLKDTVNGIVCIIFARILLMLPFIKKILHRHGFHSYKNSSGRRRATITLCVMILLGFAYWWIDTLLDIRFYPSLSFAELFFYQVPIRELTTRLIILGIFFFLGVIGFSLFSKIEIMNTRSQEILQQENQRLKEIENLKDFMIRTVSHELKTPMVSIMGAAEILDKFCNSKLDSKDMELLNTITHDCSKMKDLIDEMVQIIRIQTGDFPLQIEETDMVQIAKMVINETKMLASRNQHSMHLQSPESLLVKVDERKIAIVITNLVTNAIKNTPPNGTSCIRIETMESGNACFSIKDTGFGLSPEEIDSIFNFGVSFDRPPTPVNDILKSTGWGLYIANHIVKAHGGRMRVKSAGKNKGSEFRFEIPAITSP